VFSLIKLQSPLTVFRKGIIGYNNKDAADDGAPASDYGKRFSALVIGMVPMLVFYMAFREQIARGVAAGAAKG
jgi:ABC-type glycerol-3-phosphate transport system permease component